MPEAVRSRAEVVARIEALRPELERLAVRSLSLFGSAGRDEIHEASDVDLLVEFDGPTRFDAFVDLRDLLEEALGRRSTWSRRQA